MTLSATHMTHLSLLVLCMIPGHREVSAQTVTQDADVSARQMIEIGEESLRQLDDEILRLKNLDPPPDEQIAEKQAYRDRLAALLERQRRVAAEFEDAMPHEESQTSTDEQDVHLHPQVPVTPSGGPGETERKFDSTKREFDEKMMREMARIGVMEAEDAESVGEQDGNLAEAMEAARRRLEEQGNESGSAGRESSEPGSTGDRQGAPSQQGKQAGSEGGREGDGQDLGDFEGMEPVPDGQASEEGERQESEEGDWGASGEQGREGEEGEGEKSGDGEQQEGEEGEPREGADGLSKEGEDDQETGSRDRTSGENGERQGDGQREGAAVEGRGSSEGRQPDGDPARAGPGGDSGESEDPSKDPEIGDGFDDDIVARQLREAAEKETDPELKKKLWEEYKNYKQSN